MGLNGAAGVNLPPRLFYAWRPEMADSKIPVPDSTVARVRRGVIGVLRRGDALLMVQRAPGVAKPGLWCFPGGHVESGETPREAIVRELREELGLQVEPLRRLGSLRVHDTRHVLAVWEVACSCGSIRPNPAEIADWQWVSPPAVRSLAPSIASNEAVFQMLRL